MVDYHIHTSFCGHARGDMEEYVRAAVQIGLEEIGFSGHFPLFHISDRRLRDTLSIPEDKFPLYVEKVLTLRKKYSRIKAEILGPKPLLRNSSNMQCLETPQLTPFHAPFFLP